ncbi:MAG: 50S ribosomal protein L4 [Bacteroidota bacterium]
MELPIFTYTGKQTERKATLDDAVFGIAPNEHAVYLDVKHFRANQRQGTHKAKERSEIKASTRKIQKQKGTGNARKGDAKSNIMRGGARTFGPKPRDYGFKLNKKQKKLARKSVLSYKAQNKQIQILEDFVWEQPKTKSYVKMLENLSLQGKKTLLILPQPEKNIRLASRNLPKTWITTAVQINTYQLLNTDQILISEKSLSLIHENLK